MADYKIVDAGKLEEDLTVLADAIRQRSGTSGKMDFPSGMADTVANIPSEGVTLPELADPATARDMVLGKQLYDSSGQPVTGNIPEFSGDQVAVANISELYHINNYVRVTGITSLNSRYDGLLLRPGTQQRIFVPDDQFGDADAGDVAKGKTFTSAAGLLVEGTMEAASGDGLAVTKGNTSSPTIETGLSSIDYFVLMATDFSRAGLMQLLYRKPNNAISYILCTSYSYRTMTTELNHASMASSTLFTIDGGTVTWNGTGTSAFMSGESYMWLAFGTA